MTWSKAPKRNILSTFGAEASACRDALDLAEYTRAILCKVPIGARVLPGTFAYPRCVHEDRGTALTVVSARKVFSRSGTRHKTIGFDVGADPSAML